MHISLIAAVADNGVIGVGNSLPWRIPADTKHFKDLTTGHVVLMGRKTFESIGKPLPNRTNIVVTSSPTFEVDGCTVCHTIPEAIEKAREMREQELFVVGGGKIYAETIGMADRLYITQVHKNYDGDAKFPDYSAFKKVLSREEHEEPGGLKYEFLTLERF